MIWKHINGFHCHHNFFAIEHFGPDCQACIARELTKLHEEYSRGSLSELLNDYQARPSIKGEMVLVVGGKKTQVEIQ